MEEIVINNTSKEWLKCIDVFDASGLPAGNGQEILIPPNTEMVVRNGDKSKKITIIIAISK